MRNSLSDVRIRWCSIHEVRGQNLFWQVVVWVGDFFQEDVHPVIHLTMVVDTEPSVSDPVALTVAPNDARSLREHEHPIVKLKNLFVADVDIRREPLDAGCHGARLDRTTTSYGDQAEVGAAPGIASSTSLMVGFRRKYDSGIGITLMPWAVARIDSPVSSETSVTARPTALSTRHSSKIS